MPRRTMWEDTLLSGTLLTGVAVKQSLVGTLTGPELAGMTLTRMLFRMDLSTADEVLGTNAQTVDVGVGIASREAFTAGVLPDPDSASDEPPRGWVYRDRVMVPGRQVTSAGRTISQFRADVRAQRKIEEGILWVQINSSVLEGAGISTWFSMLVRCLFLIP